MEYQDIETRFRENVEDIRKLMNFDKMILDFAIRGLEELQEKLRHSHQIDNPRLLAENTLKMIKNIRENDSLKPRYEIIYNQCIVLLVSVFASSVSDLFRKGINDLAVKGDSKELRNEELKISVSQLVEFDGDIKECLGRFIAEKNDLSFQDMKSIGRAFKNYFGFVIERDRIVNNIIMAQAGRHVIVHDSARINEKILNQVSGATPRDLKQDLSGDLVKFSSQEVELVAKSMLSYLVSITRKVESRVSD